MRVDRLEGTLSWQASEKPEPSLSQIVSFKLQIPSHWVNGCLGGGKDIPWSVMLFTKGNTPQVAGRRLENAHQPILCILQMRKLRPREAE